MVLMPYRLYPAITRTLVTIAKAEGTSNARCCGKVFAPVLISSCASAPMMVHRVTIIRDFRRLEISLLTTVATAGTPAPGGRESPAFTHHTVSTDRVERH